TTPDQIQERLKETQKLKDETIQRSAWRDLQHTNKLLSEVINKIKSFEFELKDYKALIAKLEEFESAIKEADKIKKDSKPFRAKLKEIKELKAQGKECLDLMADLQKADELFSTASEEAGTSENGSILQKLQ